MKTKKKQRISRSENKQIRTKKKNKRRIKDKNNKYRGLSSKGRNKNDKKLTNRKKRRPVKKTIKGGLQSLDTFFDNKKNGGLFTLNKELTFTYTKDDNTKNELKLGKKDDHIILRRIIFEGDYIYILITNDHYYLFKPEHWQRLDVNVSDGEANQNKGLYISNNLTFVEDENIPDYPATNDTPDDMKNKLFNLVNYVRVKNNNNALGEDEKESLHKYASNIINVTETEKTKNLNAETLQLMDKPSTPSDETLVQQQGQDNPSSAIVPVNKQIIPQNIPQIIPQNIPQNIPQIIPQNIPNLLSKSGALVPYSKNNNENNLELNEYINNLWEILKKESKVPSKVPEIQFIEDKEISPINEESVDITVILQVIVDIVNNDYNKYEDNKHYIITLRDLLRYGGFNDCLNFNKNNENIQQILTNCYDRLLNYSNYKSGKYTKENLNILVNKLIENNAQQTQQPQMQPQLQIQNSDFAKDKLGLIPSKQTGLEILEEINNIEFENLTEEKKQRYMEYFDKNKVNDDDKEFKTALIDYCCLGDDNDDKNKLFKQLYLNIYKEEPKSLDIVCGYIIPFTTKNILTSLGLDSIEQLNSLTFVLKETNENISLKLKSKHRIIMHMNEILTKLIDLNGEYFKKRNDINNSDKKEELKKNINDHILRVMRINVDVNEIDFKPINYDDLSSYITQYNTDQKIQSLKKIETEYTKIRNYASLLIKNKATLNKKLNTIIEDYIPKMKEYIDKLPDIIKQINTDLADAANKIEEADTMLGSIISFLTRYSDMLIKLPDEFEENQKEVLEEMEEKNKKDMEKNNEDMQKIILEMQETAQTMVNQSDEMTQKMINANIELMNNKLKRSNDKNAEEMKKRTKELEGYSNFAKKLIRDKQELNEELEKTRQKLEKLEQENSSDGSDGDNSFSKKFSNIFGNKTKKKEGKLKSDLNEKINQILVNNENTMNTLNRTINENDAIKKQLVELGSLLS